MNYANVDSITNPYLKTKKLLVGSTNKFTHNQIISICASFYYRIISP